MRRLLTASLKGHARRFVAGGIAIVLSVAYVGAVLIAIDTARQAIQSAVGDQYTKADLVVTASDQQVRPELAERIERADGVAAVAMDINTGVEASIPGGGTNFARVRTVPADPGLRWQQATSGRLPSEPDEVAVAASVAEETGLRTGATVTVARPEQAVLELTVVGIVTSNSLLDTAQLYMPEGTLAELSIGREGFGDLLVRLDDGVDAESALTTVAQAAGTGATTLTADEKLTEALTALTGGIDIYGGLLLGFAAIALFVALLVVANTFTIVIAQRTRELALFRCVGAAKRQVFAAVLVESGVIGLVFSAVGLLAGLGLARASLGLVDRYADLPMPLDSLTIQPMALLVPIALGVLTTMLAALAPARRATKVPPLAALHPEAAIRVRTRAGVVRLGLGGAFLLAGGAMLAVGMRGAQEPLGMLVGIAGGVVSFLGVLLFAPILVPAVVRLFGLLARTGGVPGRVAVANAVRNPRRTAATASALLVGVTLISLLTVGASSAQATIGTTLDEQFPVDLVASADESGISAENGSPAALPSGMPDTVRAIEGIEAIAPVHGAAGRLEGQDHQTLISGIDPAAGADALRNLRPIDGLRAGVVVLAPSTARAAGVSGGDRLTLSVAERELTLRVVVINEVNTPNVIVTAADLARLAPDAPLVAVWAKASDDAQPQAVVDALDEVLATVPDASVSGSFSLRALYAQIADIMLLIATGLLAVAVAIALVGVGNTLSLSVLERTRENALLRALGLTRTGLRGTLGAEALLIAGTAVLIGIVLGVVYGYAGTSALLAAAVNEVQLVIPWTRLGVVAVVALAAGLLASVLPARRAVRVPPAAALGDE